MTWVDSKIWLKVSPPCKAYRSFKFHSSIQNVTFIAPNITLYIRAFCLQSNRAHKQQIPGATRKCPGGPHLPCTWSVVLQNMLVSLSKVIGVSYLNWSLVARWNYFCMNEGHTFLFDLTFKSRLENWLELYVLRATSSSSFAFREHCIVEYDGETVTFFPNAPLCSIDGVLITEPTKLPQGEQCDVKRKSWLCVLPHRFMFINALIRALADIPTHNHPHTHKLTNKRL